MTVLVSHQAVPLTFYIKIARMDTLGPMLPVCLLKPNL